MKQKIMSLIGIIVLAAFGLSIYNEFMTNHTYYYQMFGARENRKIIIRAIIATLVPIGYLLRSKKFSFKKLLLRALPIGLIIFSIAHVLIKDSIFGTTGVLILIVNTLLLYFLGLYTLLGLLALGTRISEKFIKFPFQRTQEMFINFGIGLAVFLLLIRLILAANIMYGALIWIIFLGLGALIYLQKNQLKTYQESIESSLQDRTGGTKGKSILTWIGIILLAISIIYYMYGFQLSFIPYSTAWDANHEYMYTPKIIAENHGILRGNNGPGALVPGLWHGFIGFWFSLAGVVKNFRLGPDTIAVAMNFLSAVLVLILGMGTIKEVINFFSNKKEPEDKELSNDNKKTIIFYLGRFLLLLWLTSGMGAFLVFVDNKTDLGVMSLTMMAILSGLIFLNYIKNLQKTSKSEEKQALKYIIISGVMFALAFMAKQTAFIDVAVFGLLIVGLWFDALISIGLGISLIGMTGILKIANAPDLISSKAGLVVLIIGILITIAGIAKRFIQNKDKLHTKNLLKYIGIWLGTIIGMLLIFKGPFLLISQIQQGTFSPSTFAKGLLLSATEDIKKQTPIDQEALQNVDINTCQTLNYSSGDLNKTVRSAVVSNEDVGRYVGYGWKQISKSNGISLGYSTLRLFYPKNNTCYGLDKAGKLLCKNENAILAFHLPTIKTLLTQLKPGSEAYDTVSGAIAKAETKGYTSTSNPANFRDEIVSIKQYYENHAIKTEKGSIYMPYRYMIPLNITFNWSLQNLSSYYTDIGFIWIFAYVFMIAGLIYGLIKKNNMLTTLSAASIIGWGIWRMIGGGILWYGMGLIIWTILATILYIKELIIDSNEEKSRNIFFVMLFLFTIRGILQLFFNLIRISSQGAGGPFSRYKMNIGQTMVFTDLLEQKQELKNGYKRKDVFDLQFPHYNIFIEKVKDRANEDGVLIAGTYMQYFLHNQRNIRGDGMLNRFREQTSDNNSCRSYQRIKNNNIKYLVIDPNIGTVGMGEGNETLFNRFFAKKNTISGKIEDHGAISMMVKMYQDGYLNLITTNNLGTKYALIMNDDTMKNYFGQDLSSEDLILVRSKFAIARYFQDINEMANVMGEIFKQRIAEGTAISDIADVYGKIIDENKVKSAVAVISAGNNDPQTIQTTIKPLTQDERLVLAQYLSLFNLLKANNPQLQEYINNFLSQSLGSSSQLIVLELK